MPRSNASTGASRLVLGGAFVWCLALLLGPALRPDLDPLTTHPETYALGPWGLLMRLGYVGVAMAGGAAAYLARPSRVSAVLLAAFAIAALLIGLLPPTGEMDLADEVFPYLQFAPLAFLVAIAWSSWRTRHRALIVLAALVWLLFLPLAVGEPPGGGIVNRAADLAMGAWLATFAVATHGSGSPSRTPRPGRA
jgi:hypothetical protein